MLQRNVLTEVHVMDTSWKSVSFCLFLYVSHETKHQLVKNKSYHRYRIARLMHTGEEIHIYGAKSIGAGRISVGELALMSC